MPALHGALAAVAAQMPPSASSAVLVAVHRGERRPFRKSALRLLETSLDNVQSVGAQLIGISPRSPDLIRRAEPADVGGALRGLDR